MKLQSKPAYGQHLPAPRLTLWVPFLVALLLSAPIVAMGLLLAIL